MGLTKEKQKRAVLAIDHDRQELEILRKQLAEGGDYQVYTSGDLDEALKIAREQKVDVVLMAFGQPDIDLQQLINCLQKEKDDLKIPVIVIIESFSEDLVASALKAGAADYLTRPVDCQELIRRTGVCVRLAECRIHNENEINDRQGLASLSSSKKLLAKLLPGFAERMQARQRAEEFLNYRYKKVAGLGIGSFGEVWKVRDVMHVPSVFFVAKIPLSKKLNLKIEKEARILNILADHAGVPKIREVIEVKKKKVLIQEFVEGKTLFEVMERELEEKEAESVVIQLIDIVAYAHDLGIIHRDIKPGNVIVKPDGTIKLLDFGAAKELKDSAIACTVTGSRPYMSPEQIMGKSQRRSDVWALGVVMFVLYTGMFPFYHDVEKVLMDMILELPPPPPRKFKTELNPQIEAIILKCLEKNPEKRFSDAGTLKKIIRDTLPGFGDRIVPLY